MKRSELYRLLARSTFAAVFVSMTACWAPQRRLKPEDIRPLPPRHGVNPSAASDTVTGIRHALESQSRVVRVLAIHGMLTDTPSFSVDWQRNLSKKLNKGRKKEERLIADRWVDVIALKRGYPFQIMTGPEPHPDVESLPSKLLVYHWHTPDNKKQLIYYALLWAPFRDITKNRFLACFEDENEPKNASCANGAARKNTSRRAYLNKKLKETILVGGLADASIVMSDLGDVLREDVDHAMCVIARETLADVAKIEERQVVGTPPRDKSCNVMPADSVQAVHLRAQFSKRVTEAPIIVITHSLGGFLLMDGQVRAAARAAQGDSAKGDRWTPYELLSGATVFMMANQISLLGLGRLGVCYSATAAACANKLADSTARLFSNAAVLPIRGKPTRYIAFNDVNDLLGYELPPYLPELFPFGSLINVSVRNPALRVPLLIKEPGYTHTHYHDNPAVIGAIVNGFVATGSR